MSMGGEWPVLGLLGAGGTGKDTVAALIVELAPYTHVSLSDLLRVELTRRGLPFGSRVELSAGGDALRQELGATWLVDHALRRSSAPTVLSGIYTLAEAERIKAEAGVLLEVRAPRAVRGRRIAARARALDADAVDSLAEIDRVERQTPGRAGLSLLADMVIENDGTMEDLRRGVAGMLDGLQSISDPRADR